MAAVLEFGGHVDKYSHLISVIEKDGKHFICIDIVPESGKPYFSTEIELPPQDEDSKWDLFDQVACHLGKTICIDSPEIRDYFNLND